MVVTEDRGGQVCRVAEVGSSCAQVASGGECGVVDIVGVAGSAVGGPGGGDELHGADGVVPYRVAGPVSVVEGGYGGGAVGAVETWPEDGGHGVAVGVDLAAAGMVRLNAADPGQDRPAHAAVRVAGRERRGCFLVGVEHDARYAQRPGGDRGEG